jgi:hypothetical protein
MYAVPFLFRSFVHSFIHSFIHLFMYTGAHIPSSYACIGHWATWENQFFSCTRWDPWMELRALAPLPAEPSCQAELFQQSCPSSPWMPFLFKPSSLPEPQLFPIARNSRSVIQTLGPCNLGANKLGPPLQTSCLKFTCPGDNSNGNLVVELSWGSKEAVV